jgi:class 3 adenylate cyclase/YHS domain-containing protein
MSDEVFQAFLFADLSGFTALTEAHGDGQAADCAARFYELTQQALIGEARMVKKIGDAVMITAVQPMAAVSTALKLLASVQLEPGFPAVRCGIHMGQVIERDGDYYGAAVNLAARLTAFARSDQVLCTRPVAEALSGLDVKLRSCGSAQFKNVAQPVEVFEITGISQGSDLWVIDPVCRMRLEPEAAPARLPFQGSEYHFCSLVCAQTFIQSPEVYARKEH